MIRVHLVKRQCEAECLARRLLNVAVQKETETLNFARQPRREGIPRIHTVGSTTSAPKWMESTLLL